MTKILFVCTGNICRSPMAESIARQLIKSGNLEDQFQVDSAGIISYHSGEPIDWRAADVLKDHKIESECRSRQVTTQDFYNFDYILGMTPTHLHELNLVKPKDANPQIGLLGEYAHPKIEAIPDPYYDNNFEHVFDLIESSCVGLLEKLTSH